MEKRRFAHEFVLLLLLALAVGAIFLQSNFNFTGYAVFGEYTDQVSCEGAGHTWEVFTNETCTDITGCVTCATGCVPSYTETLCATGCQADCTNITDCVTCATGCVPSYTETLCATGCQETCQACEDVVIGGQCTGEVCDSNNLNLCLDESTCESANGFWYNEACNAECAENWECEAWSECSGGTKTRTCADSNSCGTELNIPSLTHDCDSTTTTTESETSDILTTQVIAPVCSPNWECGAWQECLESVQVRACTDLNNCGTQEGMPSTSQACVVEVLENCADGIQNQDEKGIDCGGSCPKKCGNFFTMVGSAITGQISAVFANKTNIIIFSSILGLAILGFLGFKFFSKHGIKITSKN